MALNPIPEKRTIKYISKMKKRNPGPDDTISKTINAVKLIISPIVAKIVNTYFRNRTCRGENKPP